MNKHLLIVTMISTFSLSLFAISAKSANKTQEQNLLPIVLDCNVEKEIEELRKEIKRPAPLPAQAFSPTHDDILPLWVQNGSVWVNADLQLAIKFNKIETEIAGDKKSSLKKVKQLVVSIKNICAPEIYNATGNLTLSEDSVLERRLEIREEISLRDFPVTGRLFGSLTERILLGLKLSSDPKTPKSKGEIHADFSTLEESEIILPEEFELLELNALEK